jgi:hypothetical protein
MAHDPRKHGISEGRKQVFNRRAFFDRVGDGLYGVALTALLSGDLYGAPATPEEAEGTRAIYDLTKRPPHFEPKAKSVIHLFMNGGPSQMDLFDPKPMLEKHHGQPYFDKVAADLTTPETAGGLMRSPFQFKQFGKSGAWVSDALPHFTEVVDEVALIRSMYTMHPNHEPALFAIQSGRIIPGRPSMGSWVVYGLGTENQSLPAYVVLDDPLGLPVNGTQNWQAGFLPPIYQGTRIRSTGSPILNLAPEVEAPSEAVQAGRELLSRLDQIHKSKRPNQLQLDARIASYELAAKLQMEATDALDISKESKKTLEMYGVGQEPTDSYGRRCIMARRLVERGVRFVQLYINGQIWDNHSFLARDMKAASARTDKPVAALIKDLKQRGLMKDTLVIWGGEFGRMPIAQMENGIESAGRDHNPHAFTLWMAGAGIKSGTVLGSTDELGHQAVEDRVSVTDWHATILHLLGLDYRRLVFDQNGLKEKLTSVLEARVVQQILA